MSHLYAAMFHLYGCADVIKLAQYRHEVPSTEDITQHALCQVVSGRFDVNNISDAHDGITDAIVDDSVDLDRDRVLRQDLTNSHNVISKSRQSH